MRSFTEKLFDSIGELDDVWLDEAENVIFENARFGKALKLGMIGLAASFGFAAAVWMYRTNRVRSRRVDVKIS